MLKVKSKKDEVQKVKDGKATVAIYYNRKTIIALLCFDQEEIIIVSLD